MQPQRRRIRVVIKQVCCNRMFIRLFTALSWLLLVSAASGHDIPNDVLVKAFVKPVGEKLQLLIRVPMLAMREVDFPRRGPGYLDLGRADAAIATAANQWLADNIELY